jgi:hypothetical protein
MIEKRVLLLKIIWRSSNIVEKHEWLCEPIELWDDLKFDDFINVGIGLADDTDTHQLFVSNWKKNRRLNILYGYII